MNAIKVKYHKTSVSEIIRKPLFFLTSCKAGVFLWDVEELLFLITYLLK